MRPSLKKRLRNFFLIVLLAYCTAGALVYFFQEYFLFHPKPLAPGHRFEFQDAFEEINIPVGKDNLSLVRFRPAHAVKGLVLFFHGNMQNVEHYKQYPSLFTGKGYEVWMMDYPGFGKSTGPRTEERLYEEALMVYDSAVKATHSSHILIYGKSIGTGIAAWLSTQRPHSELILETPYYSIERLAAHYLPMYPVSLMSKYKLPVGEYVKKGSGPAVIFHGTDDGVVPYDQGKKLAEENPRAELITIEGGRHNNLASFSLFRKKLDSILVN